MTPTALVEPGLPLAPEEAAQYERQLALPHLGELGQRRLKNAQVLVAGAGGIGCPVVLTLAAAGVGTITIIDHDVVEASNLPRQLAFTHQDIGAPKASVAARAARERNRFVKIIDRPDRILPENAAQLVSNVDLVLDGTDDAATRLALHDAAFAAGVPYIWGTAVGTDGLVSTFWRGSPGGQSLRELHPNPLEDTGVSCVLSGVTAPVCQAIAAAMTSEALKLLAGYGEPLFGRVAAFDQLDGRWREIELAPAARSLTSREGRENVDARGAEERG